MAYVDLYWGAAVAATSAELAAAPGPTTTANRVVWAIDLRRAFRFVAGDVTPFNGTTVLGVTGGVAGRWLAIAPDFAGDVVITGNLTVTQKIALGLVFRDQLVALTPPNAGVSIPVVTPVQGSVFSAPLWQINDRVFPVAHIQHDYATGTQVYFHVHWWTDGVSVRSVKWQITFWSAKGHGQQSFGFGAAGTVVTCEEAAAGVAGQHMITETVGVTIPGLEIDSLICFELKRVTNGGVDNADNVFAVQGDLHYQISQQGSPNKSPPFF